jgi:hypothetical protein
MILVTKYFTQLIDYCIKKPSVGGTEGEGWVKRVRVNFNPTDKKN